MSDRLNFWNNDVRYYLHDDGGYIGRSMSNRAEKAYKIGEAPWSKWTKEKIIDSVLDVVAYEDLKISYEDLKRLTLSELRDAFLDYASWHHTGAFYNNTNFYKVSPQKVQTFAKNGIDDVLANRKRNTLTEEERTKNRLNREALYIAKNIYNKLNFILSHGSTGLKSITGLYNRYKAGKLDIDEVYADCVQNIMKRYAPIVEQWAKLPADHWRQKQVELYRSDADKFAESLYVKRESGNNKHIQIIKAAVLKDLQKAADRK